MKKMGKERGMNISDPAYVFHARHPTPETDLPDVLRRVKEVQLIMVVLPKDGDYYGMYMVFISIISHRHHCHHPCHYMEYHSGAMINFVVISSVLYSTEYCKLF